MCKFDRLHAFKVHKGTIFYSHLTTDTRADKVADNMTTTNNTNNANNVVTNNATEQKPRSLKCLANDAAKAEMFSLKQATAAVKNAYDQDKERKDTRAYVESLGFSANVFKSLQWQDLQEYATTKSGRFSTWAVLNALAKYATAKDIKGEQAAKEQRKAEKAAAKQAAERMKAAKAAERKAEQEKKAEQKRQAEAQAAAKKCAEKAQRRAAKKAA